MKIRLLLTAVLFVIVFSDVNSQNIKNLKEINVVHKKFCDAFNTLDVSKLYDLHADDFIRATARGMKDYKSTLDGYKKYFERTKESNTTISFSLKFIERVNSDSTSSERGIYRSIKNAGEENEKISYGKFHIIHKKVNGNWKILLDYDSNENNSIGEDDYNNAYEMDNFEQFN